MLLATAVTDATGLQIHPQSGAWLSLFVVAGLLLVCGCACCHQNTGQTKLSNTFLGKVIEIVSGDTLVVKDINGGGVERRLSLSRSGLNQPCCPPACLYLPHACLFSWLSAVLLLLMLRSRHLSSKRGDCFPQQHCLHADPVWRPCCAHPWLR
jgi:hypothetical protein